VLQSDGEREPANGLHHLRMLSIEPADLVNNRRILLLRMGGDLLNLVR